MRSQNIPYCHHCQKVARPNILMFGDYSWVSRRTAIQEENFDDFIQANANNKLVIIEIGAGTAVPTIRNLSQRLGSKQLATVIRINPREPQIHAPHFSFAGGAIDTLTLIQNEL